MLENYDHLIIIKKSVYENNAKISQSNQQKDFIKNLFETYMGNRITYLDVFEKDDNVCIGMLINQDMLNVTVEKGPIYGTKEAEEFRILWGDKSKMMHIDGGMHECIVWPKEGNLLLKIIDFIMKIKLEFLNHGCKGGWHQIFSSQIIRYIRPAIILEQKEGESVDILKAYNVLKDVMCESTAPDSIKKLPVSIHDIRPIGSWYKQTNVFPERSITVNGYRNDCFIDQINTVNYVSLNVETNNKWPADQDALKLMATLFMYKISKGLYEGKKIHSRLLHNGDLDIHINGFIFRCFLVINKEIINITRLEKDYRTVGVKSKNKRSNSKKDQMDRPMYLIPKPIREWILNHISIPVINNQIRVFSSQFGQAYIDTCRIVKRWMSCHYFDLIDDSDARITQMYLKKDEHRENYLYGHCFTEIAIEIIIASLFIHPKKEYLGAPHSGQSGFIRFLKFLSEFNWSQNALVVNMKDQFSSEEMVELRKPLSKSATNRYTELPAMIIRIPGNPHGDNWTSQGPNDETLKTVKQLAKRAYVSIKHLLEIDGDLMPLFLVDKTKFDVLFHLNTPTAALVLDKFIDRTESEVKGLRKQREKLVERKNTMKNKSYRMWPKDYLDNPIECMVEYIREIVGSDGVCGYDKCGGRFIGVKWRHGDVDKNMITKAICLKGRMFISRCEVLE